MDFFFFLSVSHAMLRPYSGYNLTVVTQPKKKSAVAAAAARVYYGQWRWPAKGENHREYRFVTPRTTSAPTATDSVACTRAGHRESWFRGVGRETWSFFINTVFFKVCWIRRLTLIIIIITDNNPPRVS